MVGVDGPPVPLNGEAGEVGEVFAALESLDDLEKGYLALADADGVSDVCFEVHLRDDAREPAAPDDREVGEALTNGLCDDVAVVDLVSEDAGAREAEGAVAGLQDLLDVVLLDHRVQEDDLVALGRGARGDLQELEGQEVCAEHLAPARVGPVGEEHHDLFLLLDHG